MAHLNPRSDLFVPSRDLLHELNSLDGVQHSDDPYGFDLNSDQVSRANSAFASTFAPPNVHFDSVFEDNLSESPPQWNSYLADIYRPSDKSAQNYSSHDDFGSNVLLGGGGYPRHSTSLKPSSTFLTKESIRRFTCQRVRGRGKIPCGESFFSESHLSEHQRQRHGNAPYNISHGTNGWDAPLIGTHGQLGNAKLHITQNLSSNFEEKTTGQETNIPTCDACRQRKVTCDGMKDSRDCSECHKRKLQCRYTVDTASSDVVGIMATQTLATLPTKKKGESAAQAKPLTHLQLAWRASHAYPAVRGHTHQTQCNKRSVKALDQAQPKNGNSASGPSSELTFSDSLTERVRGPSQTSGPTSISVGCTDRQTPQRLPPWPAEKPPAAQTPIPRLQVAKLQLLEPAKALTQHAADQVAANTKPTWAQVCRGASTATSPSRKRGGDDEGDARPTHRQSFYDLRCLSIALEPKADVSGDMDQSLASPVRSKSMPIEKHNNVGNSGTKRHQHHREGHDLAQASVKKHRKSRHFISNALPESPEHTRHGVEGIKVACHDSGAQASGCASRPVQHGPSSQPSSIILKMADQVQVGTASDTVLEQNDTELQRDVRALLVDEVDARDALSDAELDLDDTRSLTGLSTYSEELNCASDATWVAVSNGVILDKFLDDIEHCMDHIISDLALHFCPTDAGGTGSPNVTDGTSSGTSSGTGAGSTDSNHPQSFGGHNNNSQGSDRDKEQDDEEDDGRPPITFNVQLPDDGVSGPLFACYHHSRDPNASVLKSCKTGFKELWRLNEHLKRQHAQPLFCDRCRQLFENAGSLKVHRRKPEDCGLRVDIDEPEGLTIEQMEAIAALMQEHKGTGEKKWKAIFKLVFPDVEDADIPSAWNPISEEQRAMLHRVGHDLKITLPAQVRQDVFRNHARETIPPHMLDTVNLSIRVGVDKVLRQWSSNTAVDQAGPSRATSSRTSGGSGKRKAVGGHRQRYKDNNSQVHTPRIRNSSPHRPPIHATPSPARQRRISSRGAIQRSLADSHSIPSMSFGSRSDMSLDENARTPEQPLAKVNPIVLSPVGDSLMGIQTMGENVELHKATNPPEPELSPLMWPSLDDSMPVEQTPMDPMLISSHVPDLSAQPGIGTISQNFGTSSMLHNSRVQNMQVHPAARGAQWIPGSQPQFAQAGPDQTQVMHPYMRHYPTGQSQMVPSYTGYPIPQNSTLQLPPNSTWASQNQSPTHAFVDTPGPYVYNNWGGNS